MLGRAFCFVAILSLGMSFVIVQNVFAADYIVINEIKVGGEKATDEFVELYNPTDTDVILSGWRLSKKTASGSLSNLLTEFPSVTIAAHGLLIIAHNDYSGTASQNLTYSTQSSITPDNTVILYSDKGHTVVDLVGMGSAGEAEHSPAPAPDPGMSIERNGGKDTGNNAADFTMLTTPTPGQIPLANMPVAQPAEQAPAQNTAPSNQTISSAPPVIVFNEVFPNPIGNDEEGEWIELANLTEQEADLADWTIEDASGKHYTIRLGTIIASTTIAPHGYFLLPRTATGIALNNTGTETLSLLNPAEQTIATLNYTSPVEEGYAWARNKNGIYEWTTTPSPSASNLITVPEVQKTNTPVHQETPTTQTSKSQTTQINPPSSIIPLSSMTLVLNEALPNPAGNDTTGEWVEIKNIGNDEVSLQGVTLADLSGARYAFHSSEATLAPMALRMFPRSQTKIVLNNDGDTLTLSYHDHVIATLTYGKSEENMSFARDTQGNFAWTMTPTPGAPNLFSLPSEEEENSETDTDSPPDGNTAQDIQKQGNEKTSALNATPANTSAKDVRTVAIASIRSLPRNTNVRVEGKVIVPPGVFGKTTFYIEGMQIYSVAFTFPGLMIGDQVHIQGYTSASGGETRITVPKTGWVKKISEGEPPVPTAVTAEELGERYEGMLITIEGEITEKQGSALWLDDDTGEVRVVLKEGSGLTGSDMSAGTRHTITGILSETSSGYRVLPRSKEDVIMRSAVQGISTATPITSKNNRPLYYIITSLAALTIAGGLGWKKWREYQQQQIYNTKK